MWWVYAILNCRLSVSSNYAKYRWWTMSGPLFKNPIIWIRLRGHIFILAILDHVGFCISFSFSSFIYQPIKFKKKDFSATISSTVVWKRNWKWILQSYFWIGSYMYVTHTIDDLNFAFHKLAIVSTLWKWPLLALHVSYENHSTAAASVSF